MRRHECRRNHLAPNAIHRNNLLSGTFPAEVVSIGRYFFETSKHFENLIEGR